MEKNQQVITKISKKSTPEESLSVIRSPFKDLDILCRAVPKSTPLFWATADISDAFGSVLHKKLTKIVTGMAKELIAYPNASRLANDVCYRVIRHLVSFRVGGKTRLEKK